MIENSQLLEHIGKTKTQKLIDEISSEYRELKLKAFPNPKYDIANMSIVTVNEPNETEIKSIGMSCVNDLLVENFLTWLHGILRGTGDFNMTNTGGGVNIVKFNALASNNWQFANASGSIGTRIQLGSGAGAPAFSDFSIQTVFPSSPENAQIGTTAGVYFLGLATANCSAIFSPVTDSGTVRETAFILSCKDAGNAVRQMMLAHDSISPNVSFNAGQSVNVDYIFQI